MTSSLSRLHSLKGEEDFFFCLKMHESAEGFLHYWYLRSPKDDEVSKTFNYCHRWPKNDGDFKTFTTATDRRKTTGTSKPLTIATDRRKTMRTLKPLTIEACNMTLLLP